MRRRIYSNLLNKFLMEEFFVQWQLPKDASGAC